MCKVSPHLRRSHSVRGHFRNMRNGHRVWIGPHIRSATLVNVHCIIK